MMIGGVRNLSAVLSCVAAMAMVGCGGPYDATGVGQVTFNGAPVSRGTVSFTPQGSGAPAYGQIGPDGSFVLRTGREEGLNSGLYSVAVTANEASTPGPNGGPPPMGKPITPLWYRDPATSGLTVTVAPGSNAINLELNATPPPGWKPPPPRR